MNEANNQSSSLADFEKLNICFVMPNLRIKSPIETKFVGILPDTDARVIEIAKRDAAVNALINGFSDRWGTKHQVSVMVVHKDAPKRILEVSALVSFRNIFAICRILQSWQFSIGSPNAVGTRFSDYFDFYPFSPTRDGKELLHMGFALNALDTPENFRGQIYPDLPLVDGDLHFAHDENLFEFLKKAWVERFEKGRRDWPSNKLFRSLAIAYHASSLPKKNGLWFYDFGVSVALWISALEILAHPGKGKRSDLRTVLDLLAKGKFSDPFIKRKRMIRHHSTPNRAGNAAEYLYWRLYDSRNAFLHGNPVTAHDVLYKRRSHASLLTSVAPVLYCSALLCHFDWFNKRHPKIKIKKGVLSGFDPKRHFTKSRLETALKCILTGKDKRLLLARRPTHK